MTSSIRQGAKQGNFGVGADIMPISNKLRINLRTCMRSNGSKTAPLRIQSVLPDTSTLKFIDRVKLNGQLANRWQDIYINGKMRNTYTYYVSTTSGAPLRYEMLGYDPLFDSHYDRYIIDYFNYSTRAISPEVFAITSSKIITIKRTH